MYVSLTLILKLINHFLTIFHQELLKLGWGISPAMQTAVVL